MTTNYLIYHPRRQKSEFDNLTVYRDNFGGNEDPYIWNRQFLHTYCHITQLPNESGQINFWVSGDTYPNFDKLYCDCVFVIDKKLFWANANRIKRNNPIVDNDQTYEHHYKWVNPPHNHHPFSRRRRYTLKAHPDNSFQPQYNNGELLDILPFLNDNGLTTDHLINAMTSKRGSRPYKLHNNLGNNLYDFLIKISSIKLKGQQLQDIHPKK
ncbi:hypothetical protein [Mesonia maritima]|uniref:Uncharacterized protein n=1 Tax=Mesonia maritima TaxID=1793873 RepID=A0ABU1K5C5_9FLAO|nr:hypothetical protein [Mesonia maritima]MDR6300814.1 hypothetical protein [Mesonia maritima]